MGWLPVSDGWRRGWDSNPRDFRPALFKSAALDRSATSPRASIAAGRYRQAVIRAPFADRALADGHLIDLRDVTKDYLTDAGPFRALKSVSLQVDRGEFIAVVGRSGSGKSTLMNMITGIDRPTSGTVVIGGTNLPGLSESRVAQWRGRTVGVIFQFFQLLPTLTVVENVMLPMDFAGLWTPRERQERAMHLLELVELADQANKLPASTSGGQQQRAAIARSLANDPPLIVADEPTGNLDSTTAEDVFTLFSTLVDEGRTIVMVTHDPDLAIRTRRTVHMVDGEILDGTLGATQAAPAGRQPEPEPSAA
jgi:putative ABC transport system ATP-binding protein